MSALELRVAHLENSHVSFQEWLVELQLQAEDFKNHSCRNNLWIRGLLRRLALRTCRRRLLQSFGGS